MSCDGEQDDNCFMKKADSATYAWTRMKVSRLRSSLFGQELKKIMLARCALKNIVFVEKK